MSFVEFIKSGSYIGNGLSQKIVTGYRPTGVQIYDWATDSDISVRKTIGMDGGTCLMEKTVGSSLKRAKLTSDAVVLEKDGFSVGSNIYVNATGKTYIWVVETA